MLPDFLVIGGMKCGTTSLDHYLKAHQQISMPEKEVDFFSRNYNLGLEWYKSKFAKADQDAKILGETSVSYAKYPLHDKVPERIYQVLPNVKLIYVVRDPIARIISHYMHLVYADSEARPIEAVFKEDGFKNLYVYFSLYYLQLEKYLQYFDKDQFLIICTEDLREISDRIATLHKIFHFLGVDTNFESSRFYEAKQQSTKKGKKNRFAKLISSLPFYDQAVKVSPTIIRDLYVKMFTTKLNPPVISNELKNRLVEAVKADTDMLKKFTGYPFDHWGV